MNVPIRPETSTLNPEKSPGEKIEKTKPEHLQKVTKGKVTERKPSFARKVTDVFIAEDVDNVKSFLIFDVIVPTVKNMILDSLELMMLGTTSRTRRGGARRDTERVSYNTYYDSARSDRRDRRSSSSSRGPRGVNDIVFETRGDCEDVINALEDALDEYGQVSLADLYELSGIEGEYTDNKWGWTRGARFLPQRVREGYIIDIPKMTRLD